MQRPGGAADITQETDGPSDWGNHRVAKRVRVSRKVLLTAGGTLVLLTCLALFYGIARIWTDYAWYRSLGHESVFTTRLTSQAAVLLIIAISAFIVLSVPARAARRIVGASPLSTGLAVVGPALCAVLSGWNMSQHWMVFRMAVSQPSFGIADPQFNMDTAFFVFRLPALELLHNWLFGLIVLSFLLVLGIIFLPLWSGMSPLVEERWTQLRSILIRLLGFLILYAGLGFVLAVYNLVLSTRTAQTGASYTDVHAQLPANWLMAAASLMLGVVLLATAHSRKWPIRLSAFGVWIVVIVIAGNAWPAVMQTYIVTPNEITLELPYIERNIAMTRTAFGLSSVGGTSHEVAPSLTESAASSASDVLLNARLWTPESVKRAYTQLQTIRPYYTLSSIQVDRYEVAGKQREVLVSAREMDTSGLPSNAQTWVNQHLVYTHGTGLIISPVGESTERGFPDFLVGDVPPKISETVAATSPDLVNGQPRIYFGARTNSYAIVNTGVDEFDYPLGESNATYRYEPSRGVKIGSFLQRLAWAFQLNSDQIVFSEYLNSNSRVLLHRNVKERAQQIAPWLQYAAEPYPALVDGGIVWILDAFTTTGHFPYSQQISSGANYMRNSVKVVIDAFTGDLTFYAYDEDPVRDAWGEIFPSVLTPIESAPEALAAHFRYPKALFSAQEEIYCTYHMTDPTVFYNKEDQWQVFRKGDDTIKASYLTLDPPNTSSGAGLYLVQPYAAANRNNMIGFVAAACDVDEYGEREVYLLPKDRVILGPAQVRAQINQDPKISPQLSLWDQRGSDVVFGDMLVLPLEGTIIYVQPIFLQADTTAITQLVSVVVMNGDRLEMGATLADALGSTYSEVTSPPQ